MWRTLRLSWWTGSRPGPRKSVLGVSTFTRFEWSMESVTGGSATGYRGRGSCFLRSRRIMGEMIRTVHDYRLRQARRAAFSAQCERRQPWRGGPAGKRCTAISTYYASLFRRCFRVQITMSVASGSIGSARSSRSRATSDKGVRSERASACRRPCATRAIPRLSGTHSERQLADLRLELGN
jgi:hypothetical protein